MALFEVIKPLYTANMDERYRFFVNQGGTSSGKTYTLMQLLIVLSFSKTRAIITVTGQDLPNLKVGAMRDLDNIIHASPYLMDWFTHNKSDSTYRGKNGTLIEFKSYADAQDAKNGKRDWLFVNEANGVSWEIFWQLQIRTRKQVFIDYNPTARFWAHDKLIGREDCKLIISDHRQNTFLTEDEHRKIEEIEDRELWMVYARGLTGKITGLVFTRWDIVDAMPPLEDCKLQAWGMDFGFTNDPTALVEVRLAHGDIWVDLLLYEAALTNPDIADRCKRLGLTRKNQIIADCAEPKSITELINLGLNVVPSQKGKDSIVHGIDILKRYNIHITRRSAGLIEEMKQYKWKVLRTGETTNEPIDTWNHAIDALRYVAQARLRIAHTGTARARLGKL